MTRIRRSALAVIALTSAVAFAGCGGGLDVSVVIGGTRVARLDIALSRSGPQAIRIDWSDDRYVDSYVVRRDGSTLAGSLTATTLTDASVVSNARYCYQVLGYDFIGVLISASEVACIVA
jgi:hypothetical protein